MSSAHVMGMLALPTCVFVCSEADVGLVLALLVAVTNGDAMERADAVHAVLKWRSGAGGVSQATATVYIAALKVCVSSEPACRSC